jgi:hypothetical protein
MTKRTITFYLYLTKSIFYLIKMHEIILRRGSVARERFRNTTQEELGSHPDELIPAHNSQLQLCVRSEGHVQTYSNLTTVELL